MTILTLEQPGLGGVINRLKKGEVIALPTETVYGLAGDATDPKAVAAVYAAKGRPRFNPLIAHVLDLEAAQREAALPAQALLLAQAFWPGPLTLVAARAPAGTVCDLACAGLASIAVRVPDHWMMQDILFGLKRPLAAPSANRSGRISPTTAQDVEDEFAGAIPVLDGGPCARGVESTIVAFPQDGPPALLRPGAIPREAIEALIGPLASPAQGHVTAPGMLASHYAPGAPVRLNALTKEADEVLIGFGPVAGDISLSPSGDLAEAAAKLYAALRAADQRSPKAIAMAPIPQTGLGEAINDRLARAAAPR